MKKLRSRGPAPPIAPTHRPPPGPPQSCSAAGDPRGHRGSPGSSFERKMEQELGESSLELQKHGPVTGLPVLLCGSPLAFPGQEPLAQCPSSPELSDEAHTCSVTRFVHPLLWSGCAESLPLPALLHGVLLPGHCPFPPSLPALYSQPASLPKTHTEQKDKTTLKKKVL